MKEIVYELLALLLCGEQQEKRYILDNVKPEYFEYEALSEFFKVVKELDGSHAPIDLVSVREALIKDKDPEVQGRRIRAFCSFFMAISGAERKLCDEEVRSQISVFIATICGKMTYSTPVEYVTKTFIGDYVGRARKEILTEYSRKLRDCPSTEISDELAVKMKTLEALLQDDQWKNYVLDIATLIHEPDEVPLIFRKGQGYFYRGNVYLISGFAGVMKSFLALTIAASASNKGTMADRTLSFCSTAGSLRVIVFDTELARNTIKKRMKSFMKMVPEIDLKLFRYISLLSVQGGIDAKLNVFDDACRQFKPDLILIDSARDLCRDFNDNREADGLVSHFKQIATDLNAVLITTSHKSLVNGNAKGHFGMRLNEAAGLELSLKKDEDALEKFIKVEFPKKREDEYEPFCFRLDPEIGMLVEYAPTVDHTEERRQYRVAKDEVSKLLRPGQKIRHKELVRKLVSGVFTFGGKNISERTARNYISALSGTFLICNEDGTYSLANPNLEIEYGKERDDGN